MKTFLNFKVYRRIRKISFKDPHLSTTVKEILEFSTSNIDKELENFDLKSYLLQKGLNREIQYIFRSELLNTYSSIIRNNREEVERGFMGLLELQRDLIDESDLNLALSDLEQKMDEKSFENFMRIKKRVFTKTEMKKRGRKRSRPRLKMTLFKIILLNKMVQF